jgi:O-antigen ligase
MTEYSTAFDLAILILVILVLLFTPFAFGGVNQTRALLEKTFLSPILFYSNYFARLAIVLAAALWLIKMIAAKEIRFVKTPLDIPVALFLAYTFFWFLASKARCLTGGELANIIAYVALYYVVVNNIRTKVQMNIIIAALIISAFLNATIGLIQCSGYILPSSGMQLDYAINLLRPEQYWGRVGGTFVCPNHFAGFMEMAIPFALAYVLFSKIPLGRKVALAFCGLIMTMGLLLSISRGGWAAFAVSAAFLFALAARAKKVPVAARVIPLVVILIGLAVVFTRSAHVRERFMMSFSEEDSSYLKRAHVWLDTVSLVRDHLLFGTGPGTFELAYREYRRPSVLLAIRYAHNDYLHTLADYGIIGLAIVLSGVVTFTTRMWAASKKLKRSLDKTLSYGILGALIAILVHSLVDFNMHIPSNAMTMAVIVAVGMCLRLYRLHDYDESVVLSGRTPRLFSQVTQLGLVAVVLLGAIGVLYLNFRAYASALVMHQAAEKDPSREFPGQKPDQKDFDQAARLYRKSAALFPSAAKPWAAMANMYLSRADDALAKGKTNKFRFLLLGGREATKDYREAAQAIKNALKRDALDSSYHLMLARAYAGILITNLEYKEGSPTQYSPSLEKELMGPATEAFQKALEMDPNNAAYHEHLGFFYYRTARYDQAEKEVQQALEILPSTDMYSVQRKHLLHLLDTIHEKQ